MHQELWNMLGKIWKILTGRKSAGTLGVRYKVVAVDR
jgi:hypothetical protein